MEAWTNPRTINADVIAIRTPPAKAVQKCAGYFRTHSRRAQPLANVAKSKCSITIARPPSATTSPPSPPCR